MKWSDIVRVAAVVSMAQQALGFSHSSKPFSRSKVVLTSSSITGPISKLDVLGDNTDVAFSKMGDVIFGEGSFGRFLKDSTPFTGNVVRAVDKDIQVLDRVVEGKAELTDSEFLAFAACIATAGLSPLIFAENVVEILVPISAAIPACIAVNCEYKGKISVANGKEVSAITLGASAEAESIVCAAERNKAITPLCAGVAVVGMAMAISMPTLSHALHDIGKHLAPEAYLIWPLVSIISAAIGGIACEDTQSLCKRSTGTGVRRFAMSESVGRTWKSSTEMIVDGSISMRKKIRKFVVQALPAPLLAMVIPGALDFKCVVAATVAMFQAHYYWRSAEYEISIALDSVSRKRRAAAISDTYGNQGMRSGAILPFTSVLSGLAAATSLAAVETLSEFNDMPLAQSAIALSCPLFATALAAAASVSKARSEVNAEAARVAAETFASTGNTIKVPTALEETRRLIYDQWVEPPLTSATDRVKSLFKPFRKLRPAVA